MACAICLEEFERMCTCDTRCGHRFHVKCLVRWFATAENCPICRADLSVHVVTRSISRQARQLVDGAMSPNSRLSSRVYELAWEWGGPPGFHIGYEDWLESTPWARLASSVESAFFSR